MRKIHAVSTPDLKQAAIRTKEPIPVRKADIAPSSNLLEWSKGRTYHIYTYGCQANVRDSEFLRGYLEELGMTEVEDSRQADVTLFNTCAIRENAETKIYGELGQMKQVVLKNPEAIVGVCGCMMQEEKPLQFIREHFPYVNLLFGTHNIDDIYVLMDEIVKNRLRVIDVKSVEGEIIEEMPSKRFEPYKAFVNIMYGCDKFCTYCIVPYTRGKQRSRQVSDIVKEVEELKSQGYKEVTLLGQNVNAYGKDLSDPLTFDVLLEEVAKTGITRVRFMTSHPFDFQERVFEVMGKYSNIMPSLHLPLQSGSSEVLKKMNRRYDRTTYLDLINKLRTHVPDVNLTTDIIVGFPNETEEQFEETLSLVKEVVYDSAYTFIFSPRPGTPAARMKDETPMKVKKERFMRLKELIDGQATDQALEYVDRIVEVLFDSFSKRDKTRISGYERHGRLVHVKGDESLIGQIKKVKIVESRTYSLIGEIIDD